MFTLIRGGITSTTTTVFSQEFEDDILLYKVTIYSKNGYVIIKKGGQWIPTEEGEAVVPVELDLTHLPEDERMIRKGDYIEIQVVPTTGTCEYTIAIVGRRLG